MKSLPGVPWGLALLLSAAPAMAEPAHGAHEHGVAELRVAIEAGALEIEFVSPLDSLVGFEHAPRTAAQRKALAAAETTLRDAAQVFALPAAAQCALQEAMLASPWPQGAGSGQAHDAAAGGDHAKAGDHDEGHTEMVATYRLQCAQPAALDALQLRLFAAFPRLREVRAERVSARGQAAARLTARQASLAL